MKVLGVGESKLRSLVIFSKAMKPPPAVVSAVSYISSFAEYNRICEKMRGISRELLGISDHRLEVYFS